MAEGNATTAEPTGAEPTGAEPHGTDWKAEARKWEERAKANKAKADQWGAFEEKNKTELQKANEKAEKYKAELEAIKADQDRVAEVAKAAKEAGVDEALLARMSGDVSENAKFLKEIQGSTRRYPPTRDNGERNKQASADGVAQATRMLFGRD